MNYPEWMSAEEITLAEKLEKANAGSRVCFLENDFCCCGYSDEARAVTFIKDAHGRWSGSDTVISGERSSDTEYADADTVVLIALISHYEERYSMDKECGCINPHTTIELK